MTTTPIVLYKHSLESIAFKIVGSIQDAEDIVQDIFLKWLTIDQTKVLNTKNYLIKSVKNASLNHIRNTRFKKNTIHIDDVTNIGDNDPFEKDEAVEEKKLYKAFSIFYNALNPIERSLYILKEIFNYEYKDLQDIFGKKIENCRQIVSRSRKKIEKKKEMSLNTNIKHTAFETFKQACFNNDISEYINLLKEEINHNKNEHSE
ncbi:MAG: sigma-70 family RNA polymerase sigma factor [Chitinophagaceae bacterium]|nr:sigma-70 family RNA polymerase sigma factor [Chitinophagaceae bacterium]